MGFGGSDSESEATASGSGQASGSGWSTGLSKAFSDMFNLGSSQQATQSGFGQTVFNPAALQGMQAQLGNLFGTSLGSMAGLTPGAIQQQQDIFAQTAPAWQQQLGGGAYQGMDLQRNYQQALGGGGAEQALNEMIMGGSGNDYVDAMNAQMQRQAGERLGQNLAAIDARAAGGGMGGSSRHGLVQARAIEDANRALTDAQTQLGLSTFDRDLDRKLDIARRADQFDLARLESAQNMLGQQQQAMQGGLGFGQGMQQLGMGQYSPIMMPWQAAGAYSNAFGAPVVLGSGMAGGTAGSEYGMGATTGSESGFGSGSEYESRNQFNQGSFSDSDSFNMSFK